MTNEFEFSCTGDCDAASLSTAVAALATAAELLGRATKDYNASSSAFQAPALPLQLAGIGSHVAALFENLGNSTRSVEAREKIVDHLVEMFSCLSQEDNEDGFSLLGRY